MPITYTNRKNKTYYLTEGKTKTGKPKYYFSMKTEGKLADEIPAGYEIYEHPSEAQVFLRKQQPRKIAESEERVLEKYLKKLDTNRPYILDARGETVTIFESNTDPDQVRESYGSFFGFRAPSEKEAIVRSVVAESYFRPIMRFALEDEKKREFVAERFCFRGAIDDWIYIGGPDPLEKLARKYIKHLCKESFFELY